MSDNTVETPVEVNGSHLPEILAIALRYGINALGGVLATWGVAVDDDGRKVIAGVVMSLAVFLWGQWESYRKKSQAKTMANLLPNNLAVVK